MTIGMAERLGKAGASSKISAEDADAGSFYDESSFMDQKEETYSIPPYCCTLIFYTNPIK